MSLSELAIKRPIFVTCIVLVMLAVGLLSLKKLPVDLFPEVNFPIVVVQINYPGAGPKEIETLISKPLEEELSTISGLKRLTSKNVEGTGQIIAEFRLEVDIKYAEQQVRDKVSIARPKLPQDIKEPLIRRVDPSSQPILTVALRSELPAAQAYDLAKEVIKPRLEQVQDVGLVEILGGQRREIHVLLDRKKLKDASIAVSMVAERLRETGENIPSGKVDQGAKEATFRALGEYQSIRDIRAAVVNFFANEVPVTIGDLGEVQDTIEDERSRAYVDGKPSLFFNIYRQSGTNTIAVVDAAKKEIQKLEPLLAQEKGKPRIEMVRDASKWIRDNVTDVKETIFLGILLTIIVVYFFLANGRSTLITGLALPNSLIGSFILMSIAGFSINIVTLLSLSLAVGLLIDDAIVVRENIFRYLENGEEPFEAAKKGTAEVRQAVIATTLVVIAVFGPVAFLKGFTGQFFRQFGLTVVFAMLISLFDALTLAPMLSAYFAEVVHKKPHWLWQKTGRRLVDGFSRFQDRLEIFYERVLKWTIKHPIKTLMGSALVFFGGFFALGFVPKTFLPPQDQGEFSVELEMKPGTNLPAMATASLEVDQVLRKHKEVALASLTVGGRNGEANKASFYVKLIPSQQRPLTTTDFKQIVRKDLLDFPALNPKVKDFDPSGGGQPRPFTMNLIGNDQKELEAFAAKVIDRFKQDKRMLDIDSTYRPGKEELQFTFNPLAMKSYGLSTGAVGAELRAQVEGVTPAKYREDGKEYDIRVRLKPMERNLGEEFEKIYVPNINRRLVRLTDVASRKEEVGPTSIDRLNRGRFIEISADIAPGAGLGDVMNDVRKMFETELPPPAGIKYAYSGDSENFEEFGAAMAAAIGFSILFIFLVLASLYESFITPLTIMLALPLAICGAFYGLALSRQSVNLFSMIGVILLLGVASKNSILLVDYALQLIREGMSRSEALIRAGKTRLRPILMTTMALIAGTLPVALGLNEASRSRTSMGFAILGGLISSTLLTLVVVPAAFIYIDRFRVWFEAKFRKETRKHAASARPAPIRSAEELTN